MRKINLTPSGGEAGRSKEEKAAKKEKKKKRNKLAIPPRWLWRSTPLSLPAVRRYWLVSYVMKGIGRARRTGKDPELVVLHRKTAGDRPQAAHCKEKGVTRETVRRPTRRQSSPTNNNEIHKLINHSD